MSNPSLDLARPGIAPARTGDWMQTFTGRRFWPLDPRPEDICVDDIAHALSLQCRYGGHCLSFYSVAEHCVLLANHVAAPHKRWALMHDASEAYLVDVPRPIKRDLANYHAIEARVMAAVAERFDLSPDIPAEVHEADNRIIGDERVNLSLCEAEWTAPPEPLGIRLKLLQPMQAENAFHVAYDRIFGK